MKRALVVIAVPLLVFATHAGGAPNSKKGQNVYTCEVKRLELGEGHVLRFFHLKGMTITDPKSPDHLSELECLGTYETMPDKTFKSGGRCVHIDRDGDKWIDRYWNDSTMKAGRFEQTGISGKYKGPIGSGSYVTTDRSTPTACRVASSWELDD